MNMSQQQQSRFKATNCKQSKMTMPLTIGIVAPSYQGKTCGALRIATGIQRVVPGPIVYCDTEGGRALEFRDRYDFEHVPFEEPYGSLDYCDALDFALSYKPSCVVVDSLSHEHEGVGGYMDVAAEETARGVKQGSNFAKGAGFRRRLLSKLLTFPCSVILCMRAKPMRDWQAVFEKRAKAPIELGYGPIGGDEFVFQMTVRFLLINEAPMSPFKGAPVWESKMKAEVDTMKLGPFADIFEKRHQLCEADGEAMARWATGARGTLETMGPEFQQFLLDINECTTTAGLQQVALRVASAKLSDAEKKSLRRSFAERTKAVTILEREEEIRKAAEEQPAAQ